ncbi:unnamed protein product, partial [Oikopleura dioica]
SPLKVTPSAFQAQGIHLRMVRDAGRLAGDL